MSKITVIAGDFLKGNSDIFFNTFILTSNRVNAKKEAIHLNELKSVYIVSEDYAKKLSGTVAWGTAGALAFGPVGVLAGILFGGDKKKITFEAIFKDGRKLIAITDEKSFRKIESAVL